MSQANRLRLWTALVIGVLLFFWLTLGVPVYTDYLWFASLGFESVYVTAALGQIAIFFAAAVPFVAIFLGNLILARRLSTREPLFEGQRRLLDARFFGWLIALMTAALGIGVGLAAAPRWMDFLRFVNQSPFGISDPLFGLDIGFFVFSLPLYRFLQSWLIITLLAALGGVSFIYFVAQVSKLRTRKASLLPHVRWHISALGAALLAVVAWGHRLDAFELVYSPRGVVFGASYTDVHADLPVLQAMFWLALAVAALLLANVILRRVWLPIIGLVLWLVVGLAAMNVLPGFVQRYSVEPNELAAEQPYIEYNINYTRQAYGLDEVDARDFGQVQPLTDQQLVANRTTLANVRLWDYRPLSQTYRQLQEIRLYYRFHDLDVDRYRLGGDYRQVILSARELDQSQLQTATWVNLHLQYTHGYGAVMNPVNEVAAEGLPRFWIKDVPPVSVVPLRIDRPEIYFGELTDNYVFVHTGIEEFDYPLGEENVYTRYQGSGGITMNSLINQLAFAIRLSDVNLLFSQYITSDSRLLMNRRIQERAELIAPFLSYDKDPYLVILDGRLYWIQDAYTVSDRYPYSQPVTKAGEYQGINYIRNSVKVVTDAYDGTITFYIADEKDPLIRTYAAIFPGLFTPLAQMPDGLRQHLRYPEGLFRLQAAMFQTYHMSDVNVFYNREDIWSIPEEVYGQSGQAGEPFYVIMRLPGEASEEFMLIQPFTPATKDNLVAWLAGRCDGDSYGQLLLYRFPKNALVFGPRQIEARIDQDPDISAQLTLWGQRGSQVIRGNLLVIPIEGALLYVEPLYLQSEASKLPELKRVIVASGERVVMRETLGEALVQLLGPAAGEAVARAASQPPQAPGGQPAASSEPTGASVSLDVARRVAELVRLADDQYMAAQAALKNGDWAAYGNQLAALQQTLQQMLELTADWNMPTE